MAKRGRKPKDPSSSNNNKQSSNLSETLEFIDRELGLRPVDMNSNVEFLPSGSIIIDKVTGGGYPLGRITEVYGPEGTGKTSVAIQACIAAAKKGKTSIYLDYEHQIHIPYVLTLAENAGVANLDNFCKFFQPKTLEEGYQILKKATETGEVSLCVIDSVAAMQPRDHMEGNVGEMQIGLHARMITQMLSNITKEISIHQVALLLVNQIRTVIKTNKYDPGPNETRTGGNALKYYDGVRLRLRVIKKEEGEIYNPVKCIREKRPLSQLVEVVCDKSKVSDPWLSGELYITYGLGINNERTVIDIAVNTGIITKASNGIFTVNGLSRDIGSVRGVLDLQQFLRDNKDIYAEILGQLPWKKNEVPESIRDQVDMGAFPDDDADIDNEEEEEK